MDGSTLYGNREIPLSAEGDGSFGPHSEPQGGTRVMHEGGKSDGSIVPGKRANKGGGALPPAESVEGRDPTKGNSRHQSSDRTQSRAELNQAVERIREAARQNRLEQFSSLWHHVYDLDRLREAYKSLNRRSAKGVDGVTWQAYEENSEANLADLSDRLKRGAYRAKPVRRHYIPKADGRKRPIGIPALEDKIVQSATVQVMNGVYEVDFKGFSYGFRPRRSQHHALDAVSVGIRRKKISWVLDADIKGFFDAISHDWLLQFIEHRIKDPRVIRHIKKWLHAGVLEEGQLDLTEQGTPQGGSISPLLANIYLHYVFDLWADQWRRRRARGDVIIVRYADDFVVGFQHRGEALAFLCDLRERFQKFSLELHPEKTRLIRFGRFAADNRSDSGEGKPETFDFLGFTHICDKTRNGKFKVRRRTSRKKMRSKLEAISIKLHARRHDSVADVGTWLRSVLLGHCRYYGVPENHYSMRLFRDEITRRWRTVLRRRSHKTRIHWGRMSRIARKWLPWPAIFHPYPDERLCVL